MTKLKIIKNLKKIFTVSLIFILGTSLYAFGEREVIETSLSNGIPIYIMKNTNNQIDSVCIGVKGGASYYTKEYSGIENATFEMMLTGSASYSKNDMQNITYATNSRYKAGSLREGSVLSLVSMEEYLEETLPLLLDGFVNPRFEAKEYENLINEYQLDLQGMLNDPLSMAFYYGKQILYEGHPYSVGVGVNPESISNLTLEAIRNYHASLMNSKRIFIVAVTSMEQDKLLPLLEQYLGKIPAGDDLIEELEVPPFNFNQEALVLAHPSAEGTGFVIRTYEAPGLKSDEYIPCLVAEHIYSQIMHNVVRAKYGACYSALASSFSDISNIGYEYLYRVSDFTDLKARMKEVAAIFTCGNYIAGTNKDGSFIYKRISENFEGFVNSVKNSMYSALVTTASSASSLCTSLLVWGDLTSLDEMRNKINSVTYADVYSAFEKYIGKEGGFWIASVGPENEALLEEILNKE
ncbi:MAG: insulinase family protein [Treponema sp.]|nr:insulinase family protein [Treponema sp.]